MALDKRKREQMLALCGDIHEDDGIDPKKFFAKEHPRKKNDRKAHQLCRQVAETLGHVLAGETGDDGLRDLQVVSVVPAPDSSRLLVTVQSTGTRGSMEAEVVTRRLALRAGRLRCEIAAAITRRKTPVLAFRVVGPGDVGASEGEEVVQ